MGKKIDELRELNQGLIKDGIEVIGTQKTAFFRISVGKVYKEEEFSAQVEEIREGFEAAVRLLELFPKIKLG